MDRQIPRNLIVLLSNWYGKVLAVVKWNTCLSKIVKISSGVRQGGILSPYLFAILVDDLLIKLKASALGCRLHGIIYNAIMYADDLLLLSNTLSDLQSLVNMCVFELNEIGLSICFKIPVSNIVI